jgi:hypothetical protein
VIRRTDRSSPSASGRPAGSRAAGVVAGGAPKRGALRGAVRGQVPRDLPAHCRGFRYPGIAVGVASPDPTHLAWLEEFLVPAFEKTDVGACDRWVVLDTDAARHATALARGAVSGKPAVACFAMDGAMISHPQWTGAEPGERTLFDEEYRAFYRIDGRTGHVQILAGGPPSLTRVAMMRVVRELAMTACLGHGGLLLHGAAFALGGLGVLLAGPKRAGKTTLLLHALQATGAAFVANDRVFAWSADGRLVLRGMPTVVTIRPETLAMFPRVVARARAGAYWHGRTLAESHHSGERRLALSAAGAATLTPAQLCRVTRVAPLAEATAWRLVFPRVDPTIAGIRLERLALGAVAQRLRETVFSAGAPDRISEAFAPPGLQLAADALDRRARELARRVPGYDARLGTGAYGNVGAAAALVAELTGRGAPPRRLAAVRRGAGPGSDGRGSFRRPRAIARSRGRSGFEL